MKKPAKKKPGAKFKPDKGGNIHVGRFYLGWRQVDLFATVPPQEGGGCFYYSPEDGKLPSIKVGIQSGHWNTVVAILAHEAMEFTMEDHKLRFAPSSQMADSHASYLFVMSHEQFAECAAITGSLMADCLPRLAEAYNSNSKNKKP